MHGKTSSVEHDGKSIFSGIPSPMIATRYHSLIVEEKSLPADLEISATCRDRDGNRVIMGLRHRKFAVEGVQFHPESVLTEQGRQIVRNFADGPVFLEGFRVIRDRRGFRSPRHQRAARSIVAEEHSPA